MARPSPITIGLTVLMVAILTLGIFVVMRPRHAEPPLTRNPRPNRRRRQAHPRQPPPPSAAPAPATRASRRAVRRRRRRWRFAVPDEPSAEGAATTPAPAPPGPRTALVKNHNQRLAEADEEAIRALRLPDATIRPHPRHQRRAPPAQLRPTPTPAKRAHTAQARLDALRLLLGNEGAQQFDKEERAAIRKLRGKYRFEWGFRWRGMRDPSSGPSAAGELITRRAPRTRLGCIARFNDRGRS